MDSCIKSFDGRTFYATDFCCCPHCGCIEIKKNGKTKAGKQRWICKGCGYGMPKNRESERDFGTMIERGSHVTHDDSNYGHVFDGCAVKVVNSKSRKSHRLMNR